MGSVCLRGRVTGWRDVVQPHHGARGYFTNTRCSGSGSGTLGSGLGSGSSPGSGALNFVSPRHNSCSVGIAQVPSAHRVPLNDSPRVVSRLQSLVAFITALSPFLHTTIPSEFTSRTTTIARIRSQVTS